MGGCICGLECLCPPLSCLFKPAHTLSLCGAQGDGDTTKLRLGGWVWFLIFLSFLRACFLLNGICLPQSQTLYDHGRGKGDL